MWTLPVLGGECIQVACAPPEFLVTDLQYARAEMTGFQRDILPGIMLYYLREKKYVSRILGERGMGACCNAY